MTDQLRFDRDQVLEAVRSKRFLAQDRASMDLGEIATWDEYLLREQRLLVPVDVQALYVPEGHDEPMVRLPMMLTEDALGLDDAMPKPFDPGTPREPGVHLHWAMPDALLQGSLAELPTGATNRLGLPPLPDRWVVLRVVAPNGATLPVVTGWVLEADRAVAVPMPGWTEGSASAEPGGVEIPATSLTGTVGGSATWSATYDAVGNRFAFHDRLDDLDATAPDGADGDMATYVVAGWWKDAASDPLDSARSSDSLGELLERLRWRPMADWGDNRYAQQQLAVQQDLRQALGLVSEDRYGAPRPPEPGGLNTPAPRAAALNPAAAFVPQDTVLTARSNILGVSAFAADSPIRYVAKPWHLRSSLLHGTVHGVPVRGEVSVDRRPAPDATSLALGQHNDDVLAALGVLPGTTPDERRDAERLLEAFTFQKLSGVGSPDGVAEIEETEHAAAFASVPSGEIAATDRFLQRVQGGRAAGMDLGARVRAESSTRFGGLLHDPADPADPAPRGGFTSAALTLGFSTKADLQVLAVSEVFERMHSKVGDVLSAVTPRDVPRPAARFTFPTDPLVGIRGAGRSLRHGGDGRGSPDDKLTCRWPRHVVTDVQGLLSGATLVPSLGSGSLPDEVLLLVREAVLLDPYHDVWLTRASTPVVAGVLSAASVFARLHAETLMRFSADGSYDGTTGAFRTAEIPRAGRRAAAAPEEVAASRFETRAMADELRRFSLVKGADPDPVGVTTWAQPWVPLWIEWELEVAGLDPPAVDGWALGAVDQVAPETGDHPAVDPAGATRTVTGRSMLTSGAATTIRSAVLDVLAAEDKLDAESKGEIPEETESALRVLAAACEQVDVSTAALDGFTAQLLGFSRAVDGLVRPIGPDGTPVDPAPDSGPAFLLAGRVRVLRARLVDAFGRLLDLPVDGVVVPSRYEVPGDPVALATPPRLLRPARWKLRLVDAATPVGAEGTEARVDQVDPTLQVSPVCGFLLPDHLDESLEVIAADGAPLGELLHEPVGGGVMWEIAPGRAGPPDSGPGFGLTDPQRPLGLIATGVVAADAAQRDRVARGEVPAGESALSAMLRAVDTTTWTVDTFAGFGSEHVAGLVGRPIAVVRTQLRLELRPPDDVDLSDPDRAAEWTAAAATASRVAFPVRVGELTRTDDGVLGFFVDDDFSRLRLVDKSVAGSAPASGRSKGQLGLLGSSPELPPVEVLTHPYLAGKSDDDELRLHLGQTVTLTVLMHPAGKLHLTSGLLPRKAVALARDWVGPGLSAMAPSLRTGPVLVETDLDEDAQVRLPKVSVFGNDQNFWWRDTPATWRSDAILAATQTALLPDTPAELREGWVRVAPDHPAPASAPPSAPPSGAAPEAPA